MPAEFATPNAVMRTYASPSLTGSPLAVWRAEMAPGAAGPLHAASAEQVIVVLEGELEASVRGRTTVLGTGDSIVVPADAERRLANAGTAPVAFLACSPPAPTATRGGGAPEPIPWAC
jgi:quercetin dioxygenase-like cupin family protein